jgi:hypothetical protein
MNNLLILNIVIDTTVPLLYSYLSVQHDVISYEEEGEEEELVDEFVLQ